MTKDDMKTMTDILIKWRTDLYEPHRRGNRAEMRRAKTVTEVIMTPTFQRLCSKIGTEVEVFNKEKLAFIAGLLSHIREYDKNKLAKKMAAGSPSTVSELRFRRLLQHSQDDRFYAAMVRIIRMLNYYANPYDLIESMYYWNDEQKKRWAYAYFS